MSSVDKKFHAMPHNAVISVIPTKEQLDNLITALKTAGFAEEKILHGYGEVGLNAIDPDGSRGGLWTRLLRGYQRLAGMEARLLDAVEAALEHGEYALRVDTDGSEAQRKAALDAILAYTDRSIFYTATNTIAVLHVGKNYYDAQANYPADKQASD